MIEMPDSKPDGNESFPPNWVEDYKRRIGLTNELATVALNGEGEADE